MRLRTSSWGYVMYQTRKLLTGLALTALTAGGTVFTTAGATAGTAPAVRAGAATVPAVEAAALGDRVTETAMGCRRW
jgi:hypothetical protein